METPSHTIRRTSIPGAAGAAITGTATIGTADMAADMKADMEADTAVEAEADTAVEADMGAAADTFLRLRTLEIQHFPLICAKVNEPALCRTTPLVPLRCTDKSP
jgi:hypothetical protein